MAEGGARGVPRVSVTPADDDGGMNAETVSSAQAEGIDAGLLAKVRGLLAKAESTTFPAESEALTAKAHELIARYAIDRALLEGRAVSGNVRSRTLVVHAPYAKARFHLLGQVARSCDCRALWQPDKGVATVFGFEADLDGTEVLYTSLLLQATSAITKASPATESSSATAAFRRAFLYAFAGRVGQRLSEIKEKTVADAVRSQTGDLLPVLASRSEAVDAALAKAFPGARKMRFSVSNGAGWRSGRDAADRASLATQGAFDGRPALGASSAARG